MIRSMLYVPASSERFIAKAHERGADAIILDLEDAVAESDKKQARAALPDAVTAVGRNGATVFVRINSDPDMLLDDAEAACRAGAFGLVVPKARDPQTFVALASHLSAVEGAIGRAQTRFIALIEDPAGVLDARLLARAPRVMALSSGGEDLALALGGKPTPDVLRFPKLMVHYAAKAEGVLSFGLLRSVADYADHVAVAAAVKEAREHGFDGASCVHPAIVPIINDGFAATAEDLAWAQRVMDAAAVQDGAFTVDGAMVDAPVIARAAAILRRP